MLLLLNDFGDRTSHAEAGFAHSMRVTWFHRSTIREARLYAIGLLPSLPAQIQQKIPYTGTSISGPRLGTLACGQKNAGSNTLAPNASTSLGEGEMQHQHFERDLAHLDADRFSTCARQFHRALVLATPRCRARFCSHSHERSKGTGKRSESEIVPCQLVVTSGDTTKMFDTTEKAFDDVPGPIQHAAIATLGLSIRTRWDHGLRTRSADALHKGARVVALVSDDRTGAQMLNQFIRARNIGNLSLGGNQPQGASGVIDGKVQFGGQSTSRAAECLRTVFFELRTNAGVRARWSNRSTHA